MQHGVVGSALALPFRPAASDAIFFTDIGLAVPGIDRVAALLASLHRYPRPGGLLTVTSTNPAAQEHQCTSAAGVEDVGHYRFRLERPPLFDRMREIHLLAPELVRSLAAQAGWETRAMHGD